MKKSIPSEIKEEVLSLHQGPEKTPYREIVKRIRERFSRAIEINFNFHDVKAIIDELKKNASSVSEKVRELEEEVESQPHYEVTDDHYIFYQKRADLDGVIKIDKYPILISTVDAIFKDYSKHGNNLSSEEILQKYNLKVELWNILKNRLRLFKSSHVVSPITLERLSPEELDTYIAGANKDHIDDRYRKRFIIDYDKQKERDYVEKSKKIANLDYRLDVIRQYLESYTPRELDIIRGKIENDDEMTILFTDPHIGKVGTDGVLKRLRQMTLDIINRPERKVNIICLGDLFETLVVGGMHKGQVESMDKFYGFDLITKVLETFEAMLYSIYKSGKEIKFYGLGGNHDRFTEKKEDSFAGIAALMVYLTLQKSLQNIEVEINILRETWNVLDIQGFRYILSHGDNGQTKKNKSQILWELGDKSKPNIIAMGDQHHKVEEDPHLDATFMLVPSIAGENVYDKKLLLSSYPGYCMVFKDYLDGTPNTYTRRFNN